VNASHAPFQIVVLVLFGFTAIGAPAPAPSFRAVEIDSKLEIGYGVALADVDGEVLDVGCGEKPYESWASASRYVGIDVTPGAKVDVLIRPGQPWPLESASFDAVVCTQVLEHASDAEHVLSEIARVLRPSGTLILSVPFIYNEHDPHHDYRRFARRGIEHLLSDDFLVTDLTTQGGVGSSLSVIFLNWVELTMSRSRRRLAVFMALMPVWIVVSAIVNACGWVLDRLDQTDACYGNVLARAERLDGRVD